MSVAVSVAVVVVVVMVMVVIEAIACHTRVRASGARKRAKRTETRRLWWDGLGTGCVLCCVGWFCFGERVQFERF